MDNTILSILGGAAVLICIIIAIAIRLKTNPSGISKDAATKFLEGLADTFYEKIMEIINNIDFSKYNSLVELEAGILNDIYDTVWEYVESQLQEASKSDILTTLALKVLNKDFVNSFVDNIISQYNINEKLEAAWAEHFEEKTAELEATADESEFTGSDYVEEASDTDLAPAQEEEVSEEELAKLNPQTDDGIELDPETNAAVEVVEDEDDVTVDKNGRKRSKTTGKFV